MNEIWTHKAFIRFYSTPKMKSSHLKAFWSHLVALAFGQWTRVVINRIELFRDCNHQSQSAIAWAFPTAVRLQSFSTACCAPRRFNTCVLPMHYVLCLCLIYYCNQLPWCSNLCHRAHRPIHFHGMQQPRSLSVPRTLKAPWNTENRDMNLSWNKEQNLVSFSIQEAYRTGYHSFCWV